VVEHTPHESIVTILCCLCGPLDFRRLQHGERYGYIRPAGVSFRAGVDRRKLAGTGSLSLPQRTKNRIFPISSGREGYRTPIGRFQVIRKDADHRSSAYGDYVDGLAGL